MTPAPSKIEERLARESAKRRNQLILFVVAFCAVAAFYAWLRPDRGPAGGPGAGDEAAGTATVEIDGQAVPLADLLKTPPEARASSAEQTQDLLAEYEETIAADPDSEEAPALLNASGNLYKQKFGDYAKAAQQYERLLASYPDWEGIARVYPELATCYDQLGDDQKLRALYREMMDRFPPETPEHQWAKDSLGLRVEPVAVPEAEAATEAGAETGAEAVPTPTP